MTMANEQEEQFWKQYSANQKRLSKLLKPLREAQLAIELTEMMEDALAAMDADRAEQLERIGNILGNSGFFEGDVDLPFSTVYLSETLISDYITETNEGAVDEDDYHLYDMYIAGGKPTIEKLAAERQKLHKFINNIEQKLKAEDDKKMNEHYAANKNWRKRA